ncbi:hypothetical protein [Nocardia terrae]|nr:hypothetical protein [Nocardia terrae]
MASTMNNGVVSSPHDHTGTSASTQLSQPGYPRLPAPKIISRW